MISTSRDLYRELARRRRLAAVVEEEVEITADGLRRQWFGAYRWDAVRTALSDEALSARMYHEAMGLGDRYGDILIGMDAPDHRRHRAVLQAWFSRAAVAGRLRRAIAAPIDRVLGDLAERGSGDLLAELCEPMPALVLTRLFGLADDHADALRAQAAVLTTADVEGAAAGSDALLRRLLPVIGRRRDEPPGDDLVSVLAHGRVDGRPLTDLEVFSHLRLLAIAGTDTVSRATANLLFALLTDPEQLRAVRGDPGLASAAVEEAIRWECPAVSVPRLAVRDSRLGEVEIPRGSAVRCCLGAANHDPDRWSEPDRFDLFREPLANAGFGIGAHACLGLHLAHQVMEHTVVTALARLPGLRFDPDVPPPTMAGEHLRAPTHLCVRWS